MKIGIRLKFWMLGIGIFIHHNSTSQTWEIYDQDFSLQSRIVHENINFVSDQIRIGTINNEVNLLSKDYRPFLNLKGSSVRQISEPWIIVNGKNGLGAFHEYGEEILSAQYDDIEAFYTRLLARKGDQYWIYDRTKRTVEMIGTFDHAKLALNGQVIAKTQAGYFLPLSANPDHVYQDLREVNENFILSKESTGFGLINREGKYILAPIIDQITHLEDDYFYAYDGNQYMLIKGREEKADVNYTSYHKITYENNMLLEYIHGKLRRVMKNDGILLDMAGMESVKYIGKNWYNVHTREKRVGLLGASGWEVSPVAGLDAIYPGSENLYPALKDGKFGFVNKSGNWVVENKFQEVKNFSNGIAAAKINGYWVYIDRFGNFNTASYYDEAKDYHRGLGIVRKDSKSFMINSTGERVSDLSFDKISLLPDNYYLTEVDGKFGLLDTNGKEIASPQFDMIRRENYNVILAFKNGKYGIIDETGDFKLPLHYDKILFDPSTKQVLAEDKTPIKASIEQDSKGSKRRKSD
ncbi:WG repeat-containing protein [Belliella kenyensis]|uniref:WG repeat-containing protein n=1 Tax=Belliella kenyensis TaxID=1472724 RepID=A0ABV8EHD5_9BACT|nr:WG repeat-containing protein [Belliella kenyensis]MCH7403844.1 WG repeat-containing protein [Belliella kenyensis]MDN3603818.1 WG repeat-containing protein [Belliella kenyensis]